MCTKDILEIDECFFIQILKHSEPVEHHKVNKAVHGDRRTELYSGKALSEGKTMIYTEVIYALKSSRPFFKRCN